MRALITFIAILTVGIVTAQAPTYHFNNDVLTARPNFGSVENYKPIGELRTNLRTWYPEGTSRVNQFRQDELNIDFDLQNVFFGPVDGTGNNGRQRYGVSLRIDGGDNVRFFSNLPTQVGNTITLTGERDLFRAAEGYNVTVTIVLNPALSIADMFIEMAHPNDRSIAYRFTFATGIQTGTGLDETRVQAFQRSTCSTPNDPACGFFYGHDAGVSVRKYVDGVEINRPGDHTMLTTVYFDYIPNHTP